MDFGSALVTVGVAAVGFAGDKPFGAVDRVSQTTVGRLALTFAGALASTDTRLTLFLGSLRAEEVAIAERPSPLVVR